LRRLILPVCFATPSTLLLEKVRLSVTTMLDRVHSRARATWSLPDGRQPFVRPGKLLKMIVWRGGTRSDRASHRT